MSIWQGGSSCSPTQGDGQRLEGALELRAVDEAGVGRDEKRDERDAAAGELAIPDHRAAPRLKR